ncbi:MAG TPA: SDR family oxidoreductase [Candidatus Angelobacter sp.]|jgi:NAD(P)-dependent dehydrogenase (short-subunit alcohol dehydrogenase family)
MQIKGKVVVVTGGANGIGRALCLRFAQEGARLVAVSDIDEDNGFKVMQELGEGRGAFVAADISKESQVKFLVDTVTEVAGQVDIFCSNAGIAVAGGPEATDHEWKRSWEINTMSHVYAARAVLPQMLERKQGYLVQTISAAGLLTSLGSAPYAVTKHAALGFAEWLAITYGEQGIRVSALCPQGVHTNMLKSDHPGTKMLLEGAIEPEQVADDVVKAITEERFMILPHPEAGKYFQNKANDYDRWIRGMMKLQRNIETVQ